MYKRDRCSDILTVGSDGLGARPCQMAALRARMTRASADVIGIEEKSVVRVKDLVARHMPAEHELFKEPCGMGTVPFCRARIRHRLDELVLCGQGSGAPLCLIPHSAVGVRKRLRERGFG